LFDSAICTAASLERSVLSCWAWASAISALAGDGGGTRAAEVADVVAAVLDGLDLEVLQHQPALGEHRHRDVLDLLGEVLPLVQDRLDGERARDRAEHADQHLAGLLLDHLLLPATGEPLGGGADHALGAADLDHRDRAQRDADAALGGGVLGGDREALRGERQPGDLLEDRLDEGAAADHDALAGQVGALLAGLRVDHRDAALAAGDDQRLVGGGDLEPHLRVDRGDDRQNDHDHDGDGDDQGGAGDL
jgi:hypothetical protein